MVRLRVQDNMDKTDTTKFKIKKRVIEMSNKIPVSKVARSKKYTSVEQVSSAAINLVEVVQNVGLTIDWWTEYADLDEGDYNIIYHRVGFILEQANQLLDEVDLAKERLENN